MRISSQILISIVAGFSLAVPAPPINIESNTVEGNSVDSGDIASEFLSSLIANASQANVHDSSKDRRSQSSLQVNLGYAKYKGYYDSASDLNIWKGYECFNFNSFLSHVQIQWLNYRNASLATV